MVICIFGQLITLRTTALTRSRIQYYLYSCEGHPSLYVKQQILEKYQEIKVLIHNQVRKVRIIREVSVLTITIILVSARRRNAQGLLDGIVHD
jgi:hypothetical protein